MKETVGCSVSVLESMRAMCFKHYYDGLCFVPQMKETVGCSVSVLESCYHLAERDLLMPTARCFGSLNENIEEVSHAWRNGVLLASTEWKCQVGGFSK